MFNYSFWADEAFISAIAARLVRGQISFFDSLQIPGVSYQKLHMLSMAFSYRLFGISEFAGRLPAILTFILGIFVVFFLAKKLSNIYGAAVGTFLYALSHLNLSYATQAKPYAAIETLTLGIMLLLLLVTKERRKTRIITLNFGIILLCTIATFFHFIGFLLWIFYFVYVGSSIRIARLNKNHLFALVVPIAIFAILAVVYMVPTILVLIKMRSIFSYNHLYQVARLFGYQYFFISLFVPFGFLMSFSKNKVFSLSVLIYAGTLLILASFQHYIFNIRYVLSFFGILFLYFGVFWGEIAQKYLQQKQWLVPIAVLLVLCLTGYKIVKKPQAYYSPNTDKYGDVQIANYKDFYAQLKRRYPDYKALPMFSDTFDTEEWYFGRYSTAYFQKFVTKPTLHPVSHRMIYGSLADFKKQIKKYPKGLVMVEDWESFMPEDIKQYIKKNLKLEYRIESLKEAPNDPWPLALYSWGM